MAIDDMTRRARDRLLTKKLRRVRRLSPNPKGKMRNFHGKDLKADRAEAISQRLGNRIDRRLEGMELPSMQAFNKGLRRSDMGRRAFIRKRRAPVRRERRLDENPLYNPSVQLSGGDLLRAAQQLAKLETRPGILALDQQIRTTQEQGRYAGENAERYYRQLAEAEMKGVDRQRALADRLNAALEGLANQTSEITAGAADDAAARFDADDALRGEGLQGGAREQLAGEYAARTAGGANNANAFRSFGMLQGANAEQLSAMMRRSGMLQGAETQDRIGKGTFNTVRDLAEQRADLRSSRGQLATKYLTDLRQTGFENLLTTQGLKLDQSKIAADAAEAALNADLARDRLRSTDKHNRALESAAVRGQNVTMRGQDMSAEQREADRRARRREARRDRRQDRREDRREDRQSDTSQDAVAAIRAALDIYKRVGDMSDAAKRLRRLEKPPHPEIINAAAGLYANGYISGNTIRALRQMGVHVPREWRRRRRR